MTMPQTVRMFSRIMLSKWFASRKVQSTLVADERSTWVQNHDCWAGKIDKQIISKRYTLTFCTLQLPMCQQMFPLPMALKCTACNESLFANLASKFFFLVNACAMRVQFFVRGVNGSAMAHKEIAIIVVIEIVPKTTGNEIWKIKVRT